MASPRLEIFFLYDPATGAPKTGVTGIVFDTYINDLGTAVTQPAITEIGGGSYGFLPAFADPSRGIVYVIDAGSATMPQRLGRYMRPEDWNTDNIVLPNFTGFGGSASIITASAVDNRTVQIVFSHTPNQVAAETPSNYSFSSGLSCTAVTQVSANVYNLTTTAQTPGTTYTITTQNI